MNLLETDPFISLFRAAYRKCFKAELSGSMSEPESRHLSNEILERTGLVIGAKSIRNYSQYASGQSSGKTENPSTATLDTFARYVLNGPYSNELTRKKTESHFPYWFRYKSSLRAETLNPDSAEAITNQPGPKGNAAASARFLVLVFAIILTGAASGLWYFSSRKPSITAAFIEPFDNTNPDSISARGWILQNEDSTGWARRGDKLGALTLLTLPGDNWADSAGHQGIKNLLIRALPAECFNAELHIDEFFPLHNWQQAGILLMEDSSGKGRSLRVSLAYNSFFGGYSRAPEIYLQAISAGTDDPGKPEEIVHLPLFSIPADQRELVRTNMQHAAIRVEKAGNRFRILYAAGPVPNFAFKEALSKEIPFRPRYLGLFALQGFVPDTDYLPVSLSWFALKPESCK